MRTVFYGHACLGLEGETGGALVDPWFSREGAFHGAWFQFPDNAPLRDQALARASAICVSHNHADHLDVPVLARACAADPGLSIHVPRYSTGWFAGRIACVAPAIRDRFVEHAPWERFEAGGLSLCFVPDADPGAVDAALIASADGQCVVDLNDAHLSTAQLERVRAEAGRIDVLALQCSGASEYPVCYDMPLERRRALARSKRADKIAHCREIIELLAPERVLLCAGPPVFLDPALAALDLSGVESVVPDQLDVLRQMERSDPAIARRAYLAVPGAVLSDELVFAGADLAAPRLAPYADKQAYLADYAARRADLPPFDWGKAPEVAACLRYFARMASLSPSMSDAIGGPVTFAAREASGAEVAYTVDFAARRARPGRDDAALYVLTFPASCMHDLLAGLSTWDDVFLSLRVRFEERTPRFVVHLKTLLRYMDPAVCDAVQAHERALATGGADDTFDVYVPGARYRVQRLCPHAGADLASQGRVDADGTITCLAHRFCYDLATGECENARGYQLRTERIDEVPDARSSGSPRRRP